MKILFTYVTRQATFIRRSTVLSLPLQLAFPALNIEMKKEQQFKVKGKGELLSIF
jgi:hypothetical protein